MPRMIQNREYPANTIGFHRQYAEKIYGEGTAPVLWLDDEADKANAGYDEKSNMTEANIIIHLRKLHEKELEEDEEDAADGLDPIDDPDYEG